MRKLPLLILYIAIIGLLAACAGQPTGVGPAPTLAPAPTAAATIALPTTAPTATGAAAAPTAEATTAARAPTAGPVAGLRTPEQAAMQAAGGQQLGGTVTVLGTWGGSEQDSFLAMVEPFEQATGVQVDYTGTRDLNAVLSTRVQGGNPPDLAGLPGPGPMAEFARQGRLIDLGGVLDTAAYQQNYAQSWSELGTVDGKLVGVFIKAAVKGLIWYNPKVWQAQGFQTPNTFDELMTLSQQMAAGGTAPWCVGLESGATSGWPGTDWLEDIVLRQAGADVYDRWHRGEIAWNSPEIRQAWETWGRIVGDPQMVFGGASTMLTTNFGNAGDPLFSTPPGCYMHHQATFITDFFVQNNPNAKPGEDFDFFPFPPIGSSGSDLQEVAGDLFGMFNNTPQSRALMKYLVTPEAQAIWVQRGGAISPNKQVPASIYPDALSQKSAELLTSAQTVRFDASDLMPEAMNNAFLQGILDYVQAPNNLDSILANLEQVRSSAYRK